MKSITTYKRHQVLTSVMCQSADLIFPDSIELFNLANHSFVYGDHIAGFDIGGLVALEQ